MSRDAGEGAKPPLKDSERKGRAQKDLPRAFLLITCKD